MNSIELTLVSTSINSPYDYFVFYTEYDGVASGFEEWRYLANSSSVPEPAMVALLAVGLLGMVIARRRIKV